MTVGGRGSRKSTPRPVHLEADSNGQGEAGDCCVFTKFHFPFLLGIQVDCTSQHSWHLGGSHDLVLAKGMWAEEIYNISRLGS